VKIKYLRNVFICYTGLIKLNDINSKGYAYKKNPFDPLCNSSFLVLNTFLFFCNIIQFCSLKMFNPASFFCLTIRKLFPQVFLGKKTKLKQFHPHHLIVEPSIIFESFKEVHYTSPLDFLITYIILSGLVFSAKNVGVASIYDLVFPTNQKEVDDDSAYLSFSLSNYCERCHQYLKSPKIRTKTNTMCTLHRLKLLS
jgi:hypothetical protein